MKNINMKISALLLASFMVVFASCKKDEDDPKNPTDPNDSELITTFKLIMTDSAGVLPEQTFVFRDIDGDGGQAPTEFDTITLAPNTTYLAEILLLNESVSPADTISNEVAEEANDHQFFFLNTGVNVTVTYLDSDSNGLPLGLNTKWVTGSAGSGTSRITLKHQPGIKDGTQAPGETDVELLFQLRVN